MNKKWLASCMSCLLAVSLVSASLPVMKPLAQTMPTLPDPAPCLLITELLPDSGGDASGGDDPYEYVEVYNNSDQPIDFKDYSILYRYPGEPGKDLFWRPYTDETIIIQPGQAVVFWAVTPAGEAKTVADFNQHFGTSLIENRDIVRMPGGLNNMRERTIVIATNTGYDLVRASYNQGVLDTGADIGIVYGTPSPGSLDMRMLSANTPATPGSLTPGQITSGAVHLAPDTIPPTIEDMSDPSAIDLIRPIEMVARAGDDRFLATVTLHYKSDTMSEYKEVNLRLGPDGTFRHAVEMTDWYGSPLLDYYFTASDGTHTAATPQRTLPLADHAKSPSLNVRDGDLLSGEKVLIGSANDHPAGMVLFLDGQPVAPLERSLDKPAYFVFEADDINKGQNLITMGSETLYLIPFNTNDYGTLAVPVRPELFQYGQPNPIAIRAGSVDRAYYEDQPEPNVDDFNIRNVRLVLADGTVVRDPNYANPATVMDMGDNGRFLPVVSFSFPIPESMWDGVSYRWNTASAAEGSHRIEAAHPAGRRASALVTVDNQGSVLSTNMVDGQTFKGSFVIEARADDAATGVLSLETTLDGEPIRTPFPTSSAALRPGEHTLFLKAVDRAGNTSERTVKFLTAAEHPAAPVLLGPAEGASDVGTEAQLSVSVSDPSGDAMKVGFYKGKRLTAADPEITVYSHSADIEPPHLMADPGERKLAEEEKAKLGAADNRVAVSDSTERFPYQRFEAVVGDAAGIGDRIELSWTGHSLPGRKVSLYAWNFASGKWDSFASMVAPSEDNFTLSTAVDAGDYVRGGRIQALVQDEIPRRDQYDFTIGYIPDTQIYAEILPEYFESQVNFLRDAKDTMNIQYVVHVGDIVNSSGITGQWERASRYMKVLEDAGLPYGVVAGNHDVFDGGATAAEPDYSQFSKYFGAARLDDKPYYGGSYKDNRGHYDLISAGGNDFIFVYMGWGINDEDMAWMNQVLRSHPDHKAVIVLHEYLQNNGSRSAKGNLVYEKVVVPNPNVAMVLSGHFTGSALRTDPLDDNGDGTPDRNVYQMLNDYQGIENGGSGYLKLMHFDTETGTIYVNTYSPALDDYNYYDPKKDEFKLAMDLTPQLKRVATDSFELKLYSTERIGTTHAESGSTAQVTWTGLQGGQSYSWYALAEDHYGGRAYSEIGSFRTRLTLPAPDGGQAANITDVSATLQWNPVTASDGSAVTYQVYGSSGFTALTTTPFYSLTGLQPDTSYSFQITAMHPSGVVSSPSALVTFTTLIDLQALKAGVLRFTESGQLQDPLSKQLELALRQAEDHEQKGQRKQAAKKLEDFLKHLGNSGLQELASPEARQWLTLKGQALLDSWNSY